MTRVLRVVGLMVSMGAVGSSWAGQGASVPESGASADRPSAPALPDEPVSMEAERERYLRGRRLHRIGNVTGAVGSLAVPSGLILTVSTMFRSQDPGLLALGGGLFIGGAAATITGVTLSNVGAIQATRAVARALDRRLPITAGLVGFGALGVGAVLLPDTLGLSVPVGAGAAIALGMVQMSVAKRSLYEAGLLAVVPTGEGLAIAGRF